MFPGPRPWTTSDISDQSRENRNDGLYFLRTPLLFSRSLELIAYNTTGLPG